MEDVKTVSFIEAYTSKKYRYANINAIMLILAQQFTGVAFVNLFFVFIL
jgi:hypothetical protein